MNTEFVKRFWIRSYKHLFENSYFEIQKKLKIKEMNRQGNNSQVTCSKIFYQLFESQWVTFTLNLLNRKFQGINQVMQKAYHE